MNRSEQDTTDVLRAIADLARLEGAELERVDATDPALAELTGEERAALVAGR